MGCFLVVSSPYLSRFGWLINVSPLASHHCYQCYNQPRSSCSKCSPLTSRHKRRRLSKPSTVFSNVSREMSAQALRILTIRSPLVARWAKTFRWLSFVFHLFQKKKIFESNKFVHCYKIIEIDLKVMMVKVMYTLTFHRLLWSILNVCLLRKTKTIQKKGSDISQTFDLNFLPFQGHKNHFSIGHFWREISRFFQIRSRK